MSIRAASLAIVGFLALVGALPGSAHAESRAVLIGARIGTVQQEPQGTLKGGPEVGLLVERRTSERFEFVAGFTFARDPGGGLYFRKRITVMVLDVHARRNFTAWRARPYLETGVGVYRLRREDTGTSSFSSAITAPGGSFGTGLSIALSPRAGAAGRGRVPRDYRGGLAQRKSGGLLLARGNVRLRAVRLAATDGNRPAAAVSRVGPASSRCSQLAP